MFPNQPRSAFSSSQEEEKKEQIRPWSSLQNNPFARRQQQLSGNSIVLPQNPQPSAPIDVSFAPESHSIPEQNLEEQQDVQSLGCSQKKNKTCTYCGYKRSAGMGVCGSKAKCTKCRRLQAFLCQECNEIKVKLEEEARLGME